MGSNCILIIASGTTYLSHASRQAIIFTQLYEQSHMQGFKKTYKIKNKIE